MYIYLYLEQVQANGVRAMPMHVMHIIYRSAFAYKIMRKKKIRR